MTHARSLIRIRCMKNRSCGQVAETVEALVTGDNYLVERADFEDDFSQCRPAGIEVFVFPVLGHERIPEGVEAYLTDAPRTAPAHAICVTGDFTTGEIPVSRVSTEADRILRSRGSKTRGKPILIDTPLAGDWKSTFKRAFERALNDDVGQQRGNTNGTTVPSTGSPPDEAVTEDALHKILSLLPGRPSFALDDEGRCVALSLTDGAPYPRSLLGRLPASVAQTVLSMISRLDCLQNLSLAFAGLEELRVALPRLLVELDLCGNPLRSFDSLAPLTSLRMLNLGACDLGKVPDQLMALQQLDSLILAKNRLLSVPDWIGNLRELRRVTLYRNRLTRFDHGLKSLANLRILNLGASPVETIGGDLSRLRELRALGVRMTSITELPESLFELPRIEAVVVSKNPQMDCSTMSAAAASKLVVAMPSWDRYGAHE